MTKNAAIDSRLSQVQGSFAAELMRVAVDELKQLPEPWAKLREGSQEMVLTRLRNGFDKAIRNGMACTLAAGYKHVEVGLESIALKASCKLSLTLADAGALHEVVDSLGRKVVLVLIDPAMFTEGLDRFVADADQPELDFPEPDTRDAAEVMPPDQTETGQGAKIGEGAAPPIAGTLQSAPGAVVLRCQHEEDDGRCSLVLSHTGPHLIRPHWVCGFPIDPAIAESAASCDLNEGHEGDHRYVATEPGETPRRRRKSA